MILKSSLRPRAAVLQLAAARSGLSAALYGEITIKDGRVEQTNFNDYRVLRINEAPRIEVHLVKSMEAPADRRARHFMRDAGIDQCDLRGHGQADSQAADRQSGAGGSVDWTKPIIHVDRRSFPSIVAGWSMTVSRKSLDAHGPG